MSLVSLVVAMADNGVIGVNGTLPWRVPDDLRRFKALTMGKPCIMGRRTWDSLPRKPLPGRHNIVVTRDPQFRADGASLVHSLQEALAIAAGAEEICIIGGAEIYRAALPFADRIHLTEIHADVEGDTRLALFDRAIWRESRREDHGAGEGPRFSFVTLERRR
ncbi:MAG TPA: dihydrofolate reductase [Rhizomicrobium sp.]|jgi:dihydrofolate reductase|nr:dihydrofolate reductase [Rhizomicrobium sp.]